MKISAKTARKLIKSGKANVVGKTSTDLLGDQYWIINDYASMRTLHVSISAAPRLDHCKA